MTRSWFDMSDDEKERLAVRFDQIPLSYLGLTVSAYNMVARRYGHGASVADAIRSNHNELLGSVIRGYGQRPFEEIAKRLAIVCADPDRFLAEWATTLAPPADSI